MEKYQAEIAKLKEMLQTEEEFGKVMRYFFDELGDHQDFIDRGKRAKHRLLKDAVQVVAEQVLGENGVVVEHLLLTKLAKSKFYHGGCFVRGRVANVIYFEDIDMGMVGILMSGEASFMHFARFTCHRVDSDATILQAGNRTRH